MVVGTLTPRGEAMVELDRLAARVDEARARVDELDRAQRAASEERQAAREALVELERRAGGGVTAGQRRKAELRLSEADAQAGQPWQERLAGAQRAVADAHRALQRYAGEHLGELVVELEENGAAAADEVDRAAEAFLRAVAQRAEADRVLTSVVAMTRRMSPHDVVRSRTEQAAREIRRLLEQGGEAAPMLRITLPQAEGAA